jgi:hypothetical protein
MNALKLLCCRKISQLVAFRLQKFCTRLESPYFVTVHLLLKSHNLAEILSTIEETDFLARGSVEELT